MFFRCGRGVENNNLIFRIDISHFDLHGTILLSRCGVGSLGHTIRWKSYFDILCNNRRQATQHFSKDRCDILQRIDHVVTPTTSRCSITQESCIMILPISNRCKREVRELCEKACNDCHESIRLEDSTICMAICKEEHTMLVTRRP